MIRLCKLMVKKSRILSAQGSRSVLPVLVLVFSLLVLVVESRVYGSETPAAGQLLAMDRSKGNCLACHVIADGEQPGNIGPPLFAMKVDYYRMDDEGFFGALRHALSDMRLFPAGTKKG